MQNKKSPKADIGRNSSLYFAVGLALMMFLSYGTINYKVYDKDALGLDIDFKNFNLNELSEEEEIIANTIESLAVNRRVNNEIQSDASGYFQIDIDAS